MIEFILNDQQIRTDRPAGLPLLDFIRYEQNLCGTKIGCREGDCGACTVMEGRLVEGQLAYRSIVSCLTPLANVHGKHIVTVEGVNMKFLTPVQQAIVDHNGTQCGFCTPGFVMALTAHSLSPRTNGAVAAIDGNICRCTGYKSIERAAHQLTMQLSLSNHDNRLNWLVDNDHLPDYFKDIARRLQQIPEVRHTFHPRRTIIGGGTDLMVQRPDDLLAADLNLFYGKPGLKGIRIESDRCTIGATTTTTAIMEAEELEPFFPNLQSHFRLIASTPIRNTGTLGGNLVNASPIGDLTIFFLALDATVRLSSVETGYRELPLKDFFLDYKKLDLQPGEYLSGLTFRLPGATDHFNFEKVCKRPHLDIATVNTAISLQLDDRNHIGEVHLSAGGVAPVPLYLNRTSHWLHDKPLNKDTIRKAAGLLQEEIAPISDIRGSAAYKRLLLRQLFFAHFIELFPTRFSLAQLMP